MAKKTFPLLSERKLRATCPYFGECDSPLCPLDPDLYQKNPPKLTPLCYWYLRLTTLDEAAKIPSHILDTLMRYVIHLLDLRAQALNISGFPRPAFKTPTRIDDLGEVKGVV